LGEVFWHETLLRYSVAILKEKGNKVSQHLLPRKEKAAACAAKQVVFATPWNLFSILFRAMPPGDSAFFGKLPSKPKFGTLKLSERE
jgi:hypothetical protein